MCNVKVLQDGKSTILTVKKGELLKNVLQDNGFDINADCGGIGKCKKCAVCVDGENVLSCEYRILKNITVIPEISNRAAFLPICSNTANILPQATNVDIAADIGTTTVTLSFIFNKKEIVKKATFLNPQKIYGADVMSRVAYCTKQGVRDLQEILNSKINSYIKNFCEEFGVKKINLFAVCANTIMLHTFFGVDCSCFATAPYTAEFLEPKTVVGKDIGLENVEKVVSLPCAAPFFGADAVGGVALLKKQKQITPYILLDLGTNAEIALVAEKGVYCTSAAAGPCFEGAEISCGIGAVYGAVKTVRIKSGVPFVETVGGGEPCGICGTGLISAIAEFTDNYVINSNGTFNGDFDEYELTKNIGISQDDIRKFQSAKSAVRSATEILLEESSTQATDIKNVFIAGGFSEELNDNAFCKTGLIDKIFYGKCKGVSNISLCAAEKYITGELSMPDCTHSFKYIDLNSNRSFFDLFIKYMDF